MPYQKSEEVKPASGFVEHRKQEFTDIASLRRLIEMLPQIAFVGAPDGYTVYFNQYWYEYSGLSRDASGPDSWAPAVHPDDLERGIAAWSQSSQRGQEHSGEYRLRRASDGEFRWHQIHSVPVKSSDGLITAWLSTMLDVHQQKIAEEGLRVSEERRYAGQVRFKALIESSLDAISLLSPDLQLLYTSPSGERMLGYEPGEITHAAQVCHPDDMEFLRNKLVECLANPGKPIHGTLRVLRKDGSTGILEGTLTNLLHDPAVQGIVSNARDITERVQAQEALTASEAKFRALIENSSDAITLLDAGLNILYRSLSSERILGYGPGEISHASDICHPDDLRLVKEKMLACLTAPGSVVHGTFRARCKDGTWRVLDGTLTNMLHDPSIRGIVSNARDITEKVRAEEALQASEAKFRALIENSTDVVALYDADWNVIYTSTPKHPVLGYPPDEVKKIKLRDICHPDDRELLREAAKTCFRNPGMPVTANLRFRRKDGAWRMLDITLTNRLQDPNIRAFVGNYSDVTERTQAEAAVRASEAKFRALIENSADAIVLLDGECRIQYSTPSMTRILGYVPGEFTGKSLADLGHPDDIPVLRAKFVECLQNPGKPIHGNMRNKHKDGTWRTLEGSFFNLLQDPYVRAIVGNYRDITEKIAAEAALRASEGKFRALIENSADAILLLDADMRIQYSSPATERIVGFRPGTFTGASMFEFCHPEDLAALREKHRECLARPGHGIPGTVRIRHRDGGWRILEGTLTNLLNDPDVLAIVNNYRDITEKVQAEEALRLSEEKFKRAFAVSPDAITISRLEDAVILEVNGAFERLSGYTRDEAVGRTGLELGFWSDPDVRKKIVRTLHEKGRVDSVEIWSRGKDGVLHPVQLSAELMEVNGTTYLLAISRDISESRKAEEALRLSEEKFKRAFAAGPDALSISRLEDGCMLEVNDAFERLSGYTREELIGRSSLDLGIWDDPDIRKKIVRTVQQQRHIDPVEVRARRKDGVLLPIHLSMEMVDFHGVNCLLAISRDISASKQAEEALRLSEDKFKRAFAVSPDAVAISRFADGKYLEVNEAFERLSGFSRDEAIGRTAVELKVWLDHAARHKMTEEIIRSGRVKAMDTKFRSKDGATIPANFSAEVLEIGGEKCVLSISRDLRELKHAEQELRRSEEQYRSMVEQAPYGICRTEQDGRIIMANSALARILEYQSVEEVLALNIEKDVYVLPSDRQRLLVQAGRGVPAVRSFATLWKRKDGSTISVRLSGRAIPDESGQPRQFEAFVEDVSKQEALEAHLRTSQKLEAVGQLAGGIAHDFNNLLMIMGSRAEMILEHAAEPGRVLKQADEIVRTTRRAAVLTSQLLAFSRKQVLQPTVVDLNEILGEMEKVLPRLIGENIETHIVTSPDIGDVKVDRGQFEQVLMNLAINARDAMPGGGALVIATSTADLTEDTPGLTPPVVPGPYVLLTVKDTGVGMDQETQSRIFEPFFTTKERGRGTGLGLAMVYGIVKQSGGHISVTSSPGKGATFNIYLPVVPGERKPAAVEEQAAERKGTETILLVEDEDDLRVVCAGFLRSQGYKVLEACHGIEAAAICKARREPVDLLVTDVIMPRMNGMELSKVAKGIFPNLRTIFISGYSDEALDPATFQKNDAYLQKPFSMRTLARDVREILDRPD